MSRAVAAIALVGIGCRLPRASSAAAYWRLLADGTDAVSETPASRWRWDPDHPYARWGAFLDDLAGYDAEFWKSAPQEALGLDPHARLLLETTWESLEDAGLPAERLSAAHAGVFVGVQASDWPLVSAKPGAEGVPLPLANIVSYALGASGPSLDVGCACSSSLAALHLACRSLASGDCGVAITAGVSLLLLPTHHARYFRQNLLSQQGRCRVWSEGCDGTVPGEGAVSLVLKPLDRARADGDRIYAVLRGSAVNHNGTSNGIASPSRWGQEAVLREALAAAGVGADAVDYVELHGSATALGDATEAQALASVYGGRAEDRPLLVGSVKTNLGSLEAASGAAGVAKVALALFHGEIPASLHFGALHPFVRPAAAPFRFTERATPWPRGESAFAAVSAFGASGTNAHAILEAPPRAEPIRRPQDRRPRPALLPLSARTPAALREHAQAWLGVLEQDGASPEKLVDRVASAAIRRSHHPVRLAVVSAGHEGLGSALARHLAQPVDPGSAPLGSVWQGERSPSYRGRCVFVFGRAPGAEPERVAALEREQPAFAQALRCAREALRAAGPDAAAESLAVPLALASLWRSWSVEPAAAVGVGAGALAAAHVMGRLPLEQVGESLRALREEPGAADGDAPELKALLESGHDLFLELSLAPVCAPALEAQVAAFAEGRRRRPAVLVACSGGAFEAPTGAPGRGPAAIETLARLHAIGHPLDWSRILPEPFEFRSWPLYPWQRRRFWPDGGN